MARRLRRTSRSQALGPARRFELRVYRALGVLPFRQGLFFLERIKYRRNGGTNRNYHLRALSPGGAATFESYLLYHDLLHGVSLALLAAVLLEKAILALPWNGMDILAAGMCVINIWCLLLQRYNRLRLLELRTLARQARSRRLERRAERVVSALGKADAAPAAREDLALVRSLLTGLSAGNIVYLGADDVPSLRRMAALLEAAGPGRGGAAAASEGPSAAPRIDRLVRELSARAQPYSRTERRVERLRRRLRPSSAPLIALCAVVTRDGPAEAAFSDLFRCSGPEKIWESLLLLELVLERLPSEGAPA